MIDRLLIASTRRCRDRGVVLPLALALGAIMALAAGTMLARSHKDEINVVTRDAITDSESVAELAANRYKNLINTYRDLATVPLCSNDGSETCEAESWRNASAVIENNNAAVTLISAQASGAWQDAAETAQDGQYRLVDYTYDEDAGEGILIVEGRVNQAADGTESAGTATKRLRVRFPVIPSETFFGLRVNCVAYTGNQDPLNQLYKVWSNIKEFQPLSDCLSPTGTPTPSGTAESMRSLLKARQPENTPAFIYETTPDESFPFPPTEGRLDNIPATGVCQVERPFRTSQNWTLPQDAAADPDFCANGAGEYYTYHLFGTYEINSGIGGQYSGSVDRGAGGEDRYFTFDAPGQTIRLYVPGIFDISDPNTQIKVTPGTKLIIYAHNKFFMSETGQEMDTGIKGALINEGKADDVQIYIYPVETWHDTVTAHVSYDNPLRYERVNISLGDRRTMKMFLFSPNRRVYLWDTNGSITGAIWAQSVMMGQNSGQPPLNIYGNEKGEIDCENLPAGYCENRPSNQIGENTSWEIVEVPR